MSASNNPYPASRGDVMQAPFAGRQKAFEQLYQQLTRMRNSIVMGTPDSGKTAVLRHFNAYFEEIFISVYLDLKDVPLQSENDWLLALSQAILNMLIERNLSLSRLVVMKPDAAHMRDWFRDTFLADISKVTRSQRIVLLLDNADGLIRAVRDNRLPADHVAFLSELVQTPPEPGVILALDSRYEADIAALTPLADVTDVYRLESLTEDETTWLLRKPVEDRYSVNDEAVKAVYRASGGRPYLIQGFGYWLFRLWESRPNGTALTADDVKSVTPQLFSQSEADFQRFWQGANRNARLILMAMTQLQYRDPLAVVDAEAIQRWLLESDYPLDLTAVYAALRGLEYTDVIDQSAAGIRIKAGLLQTWLLDNGRADEKKPVPSNARRMGWAALIVLVVLVIVLALLGGQRSGSPSPADAPPTVTLVPAP